jgi:hypothetical protein
VSECACTFARENVLDDVGVVGFVGYGGGLGLVTRVAVGTWLPNGVVVCVRECPSKTLRTIIHFIYIFILKSDTVLQVVFLLSSLLPLLVRTLFLHCYGPPTTTTTTAMLASATFGPKKSTPVENSRQYSLLHDHSCKAAEM